MALGAGLALMGGSALLGMLNKGKGTTVTQGPLETPEQKKARRKLLRRAGQDPTYTGSLGDFEMTDAENAGAARLASLMERGRPGVMDAGISTLTDFLTTDRFDPTARGGEFEGFLADSRRSRDRGVAGVKNAASFAGNLYSSDTMRSLGDVEAQTEINRQNKLAELSDKYVSRKLSAVPFALEAGKTLHGMDLADINAAYTYGGLPRMLNTAEDQAAYQEFIRGQGVTDSRLGAVAGGPPQFGVGSYTMPSTGGPWDRVADMLAYGGGNLLAKGPTPWASMGAGGGGSPGMFTGGDLDLYKPWEFGAA